MTIRLVSLILGLVLFVAVDALRHPANAWRHFGYDNGQRNSNAFVNAGSCFLNVAVKYPVTGKSTSTLLFGILNSKPKFDNILSLASIIASYNYISIDPFFEDTAEACDLTELSVTEYGVHRAPGCNKFDCVTATVLEFRAIEESGEEFVWRADISGPIDGFPVVKATKRAVQGWFDH